MNLQKKIHILFLNDLEEGKFALLKIGTSAEDLARYPTHLAPAQPSSYLSSYPLTPVASHSCLWLYFALKKRLVYIHLNEVHTEFSC